MVHRANKGLCIIFFIALQLASARSSAAATNATYGLLPFIDLLSGTVILADQIQYAKAKNFVSSSGLPFNFKTPLMIVYCASVDDVSLSIRYARKTNMTICVRAGGEFFCYR